MVAIKLRQSSLARPGSPGWRFSRSTSPQDGYPRCGIQQRQHRVKNLAADVFIIKRHTLRAGLGQLFGKIIRTMVKAEIKA